MTHPYKTASFYISIKRAEDLIRLNNATPRRMSSTRRQLNLQSPVLENLEDLSRIPKVANEV